MGNVRMRAEQINYGASNVKAALDTLDPAALISLSNRMDLVDAWKATVKKEEKTGASVEYANALALDAVSLSAEIVATQSGSGTPSPTNIRPISGFSSVVITDTDAESHTATVTVSLGQTVYGGTLDLTSGELTITHDIKTYTGAEGEGWDLISGYFTMFNVSPVHKNATAPLCNSYKGIIITTWSQMQDGDIAFHPSDGSMFRIYDSRFNTVSAFEAWLASNPIQVCYELATPTTTTLTAAQLALVKGYNRLSADTGDITVEAYTGAPWGGDAA